MRDRAGTEERAAMVGEATRAATVLAALIGIKRSYKSKTTLKSQFNVFFTIFAYSI
jgi:hypothetical protein